MENRPAFLGRGRGRGTREQRFQPGSNYKNDTKTQLNTSAWNSGAAARLTNDQKDSRGDLSDRHRKIEEIRQAAVKFTDDTYLSSSDSDEDINDDEILRNTLTAYQVQGDGDNLKKIKQYLQESCNSRALTCLICIASVKHIDAIWNCAQCYSIFHLQCIQKWSNDGAVPNLPLSQEHLPNQDIKWFCPKCRCEYQQSERPTEYICFCGKTVNPKFDPWSVPHSCGEVCARELTPNCGHSCLLLCHPGPCPPCPKMVQTRCHCGSQPPTSRRCSAKEWSCGKPCEKVLACEHHKCKHPCHGGLCPPCPERSSQSCICGRNTSIRSCAEPRWMCTEVCGKLLECANHTCVDICHQGKCLPCPKSGMRTCPCGKTTSNLPCTEDVPVCGDTCELLLACGHHSCTRRCHSGPCETCRQMVNKICRCGKREKSIQCAQEFTCDIKCSNLRNCQRHQCRRKCCDGRCPPCEQICGRQLSCKNHKCPSVCHRGFCYPCPLTKDVSCNCGSTRLAVPCGRERVTKPPKCSQLCKIPSNCHHPIRKPHRCHFGSCPPCKQICGNNLPSCDHTCQMECHDNKKTPTKSSPSTSPWTNKKEVETVPIQCGPCAVPVMRRCLGKHETVSIPCSKDGVFSCGRPCGRLLSCDNHSCQLQCHTVSQAPDEGRSGTECEQCDRPCSKPRQPGCVHECLRRCHPGGCGDCRKMVKQQCHCSSMAIYVKCSVLITSDDSAKKLLLSCKGGCPKMLKCGHQCSLQCHPGKCLDANECSKRITVRCPCKRLKKDYQCHEAQSISLECNDQCKEIQKNNENERKAQERIQQEEEMKLHKEEVEKYERKKQGRKRRPRKQQEDLEEPNWFSVHRNAIFGSMVIVAMLAVIIYIALAE
ncbi:NF-X1-type zinc finger protein NFXL1-like [Dendronephthya gigantea]|uniref:NF-X1-type zinc finger protein NFXL1-like n=1 Tax=Dendronephthya gigantea TaxID=151771 RepID=UPI00106D1EF4|nr:NF-X1-type zinc finger protein NFXL1-like [Dendronephthya gigantea]